MKWFRCFIAGENFPGWLINYHEGRVGFYTTRWVEAESKLHAEMVALHKLRADPDFQIDPSLPEAQRARVTFEVIEEIPPPISYIEDVSWFPMTDAAVNAAAGNDVPFA